ncbi:MAG: flavodoxin family protein [Deltaproteobacteria bacterium]|nr:flavodoxin family protein [Deltaproteobacteria bacterium]
MKTKVLGISGSPRKGNSLFLLGKALEAAKAVDPEAVETTTYSFKGKTFNPCISCFSCLTHNGKCVHKDDFEELRGMWMESDAIIYSVPVYHMTYPGQVKCFIDRLGNSMFGVLRSNFPPGTEFDILPKLYKAIGNIAQGAHIFSGQESTLTDLINHALVMQSVPVQGDIWESYIGVGGWTSNSIEKGALEKQNGEGLYDATVAVNASLDMGRRVAETAMLLRSGLLAQKDRLGSQDIYKPVYNFIEGKGWAPEVPWKKDEGQ